MSKKQIRSRLEHLFTDLAGDDSRPPVSTPAEENQPPAGSRAALAAGGDENKHEARPVIPAGWAWEIDDRRCYLSCGQEIFDAVQLRSENLIGQDLLSFGIDPISAASLGEALQGDAFPAEITVFFITPQGIRHPVRMIISGRTNSSAGPAGWRGFAQVLPGSENSNAMTSGVEIRQHPGSGTVNGNGKKISESLVLNAVQPGKDGPARDERSRSVDPSGEKTASPAARLDEPHGVALENGNLLRASQVWTGAGKRSLSDDNLNIENADGNNPAAIAIPLHTQGIGDLLLEIVDDTSDREWSEDDRFLVMEVASQLSLALDNAQLYLSVQQELSERIRAEQAILRRNKDLSTLNQIGQQLSRLASREEIFDLLAARIKELLYCNNLYIAAVNSEKETLSFPIFHQDGQVLSAPEQAFGNGIPELVIRRKEPLLISHSAAEFLKKQHVSIPDPLPASLIAIPLVAGDRAIGVIVAQDFHQENRFDEIHVELLSTVAAQASTALENADLFQQMQNALKAIENRERYQSNVARSAATLTEFGTKSMGEVLKALGSASQSSRVYFAEVNEDERELYWTVSAEWADPAVAYLFDKTRILHLPVENYPLWSQMLKEKGWGVMHSSGAPSAETSLLSIQHIRTCLLLAVPGEKSVPSFLAFDQLGSQREWLSEEINALRVGADAVANTIVRERLLDQLQVTLDETEGLYKASNRLAAAGDMQEMVAAVLSGVRSPEINRAVLVLFELDTYGKVTQITVGANWYSGRGAPPPPVGTEYLRARYERLLLTSTPQFYNDLVETQFDPDLQKTLLHQKIRSLAVLPLWSGKRQIGALLLQGENRHIFSGRETRTYPPLVDQMAISVENQRLFEQTQIALSETELLYNVSNRIAQAAGAQDMLSLVGETILPRGAESISLILISSNHDGDLLDMEMIALQNVRDERKFTQAQAPVASLPLIKSLTDEPLIITDIQKYPLDPVSNGSLEKYGVRACCIVPLRTGGRMIGLLNAYSAHPSEFNQDDTRLLRIVGNGLAVALEKQRLLRQAQRRALELQTASEIARDTASTLSLDLLLNRIVQMLAERFGFYHASIFLLDEAGTQAVIRESTGEAGIEMKQKGHRFAVGSHSVVGMVTQSGESIILNDARSDPMHFPNPLLAETRSEMGIPLKLGSTIIGALDLQSLEANAFSQDEVTVLQILADQIAIAIENARAYELSQKAIEDMKEVDRVKSQFLANMSHELRTPLNSIIGFSRVILKGIDGPINETQKTDLNAIYSSGQHLLSLITDILDLSKIEAGKMELAFSDVNLSDLINSAMSTAVGLVKDKHIRLNTIIPENLPQVRADSTRVRQVLINFLSNAAKFTDEGAITVEVSMVSGQKSRQEAMVTVTDTGPGIAQQDQGKLFLPFSQVDDSPTRKTGGTGLGLSICRSLIEMHGGRIGLLRSEVGKGSTFFFTLPVETPDVPEKQPDAEGAGGNTVLAIDDDIKVISLYERYLKPHGYTVVPLTDPGQALARVREVRPQAITLDVMMPEKDGWQVLRELKNDPECRDIPIIVCSILDNQEQGFSLGAADYLVKPFLQEEMISSLTRLNRFGDIREVLIIDDDPDDLRLLQKMLEDTQSFHVTAARGGPLGWEAVQQRRPDAIIMDLFMPDLNGFAIMEKLRADPALRQIPVIILTGADLTPEHHRQLTEYGHSATTKGFLNEKNLLVLLEEALHKYHPAS